MALDRLTQITSSGISSTSTITVSAVAGILTATSATVGSVITMNSSGINAGVVTATNVNVGSAVTIHTGGFRVGSSDLHSTGVSLNNINASGVVTATSFVGNVTGNATGLSGTPNITVGTIGATSLNASGVVTATSFVGNVTGNITGNLTGNVTGNVNSTGVSTFATINITQSNPTNLNVIGISTLSILRVGTGGTIITTTTDGSVGIGSTIPGSKIDVNAGSVNGLSAGTVRDILTISESGSQSSTGQRILFKNVQQNWEQGAITALRETSSNNFSLAFSSSNNGSNVERARINSSGNLGIGTIDATPGRLTVNNVDSVSTPTLDLRAPQNNRIVRFKNNAGGDGSLYSNGTATTFDWQFSTYSTANVLYLKNNGSVGMGTDNPSAKLDVEDNTSSGYIAEFRQKHPSNSAQILIDSPTNGESRPVSIDMSRAGVLQWSLGQAYNDTNQSFHIATSAVQSGNTGAKLTIKTNGDVGIGTFNPAYKLDVRGDVLTYGLRMATDLASQTDTGNIASSATNISYRAYGGFQSYTAAVTCNNTWYTLFPNFNYSTGYIIVTAGDAGSKNVQEYAFMTTAPAYGVSNFSQLHSMGAWNTGSFELQLSSSGSNYILQARATSYYSSSNVAGIYMKIISNY